MAKKFGTRKKYQLLKSKSDPFFNSLWLSKFSNHFIRDGKKIVVEKAFFKSFSLFKQRKRWNNQNIRVSSTRILVYHPLLILLQAFVRNKPLFTVVSKRMGRVFKKIPVPLAASRQLIVAVRLCATTIKTVLRGRLWRRLYSYLIKSCYKARKPRDREKNIYIHSLVALRTNLHYRWK